MDELFARLSEDLVGRLHGPMTFRLLLQPAVAVFLAVRAGLRDERENRIPYFWGLLYDRAHRWDMVRTGWRDIGGIFAIAIILDLMYQVLVFRWVYFVETLIVAAALAVLPYLSVRGPVTRLARLLRRSRSRATRGNPGATDPPGEAQSAAKVPPTPTKRP